MTTIHSALFYHVHSMSFVRLPQKSVNLFMQLLLTVSWRAKTYKQRIFTHKDKWANCYLKSKLHQSHASFCEFAVTEKEKRILSVCHSPHRVPGLLAILLCRHKGADHTGRKPREQGSDHIGALVSFLNTTGLFAVRLHGD